MTPETVTLEDALRHARQGRWRTNESAYSQAKAAVAALCALRGDLPQHLAVHEVAEYEVRALTLKWYTQGLSPATINKRLNCLSALGVNVQGCRQREPKRLKWWLRPEEEKRAVAWLSDSLVGAFIVWSTRTGLRIEESLRLRRDDFNSGLTEVTVPGLKTDTAQATLALHWEAVAIAVSRFNRSDDAMWGGMTYDDLHRRWCELREAMGWPEEAVLKGLRRSAARFLHVDCGMPIDMVRQYLRHEDIKTTMGYLRLTGGYSLEEQRRFLGQ